MQRFDINHLRVFSCVFLKYISSCLAYLVFFSVKTARHGTPHNKFNTCTIRVKIIPIIRIKFNKILIIIYKVNVLCLVKYLGVMSMAIKKVCILPDRLLTLFYIFTNISLCHFVR